MSYCPRPNKTSKTNFTTPGKKKVNPPPPRTESCGPAKSTVIGGGGSDTTNTIYIPGPAGPAGPKGLDGMSFVWQGPWTLGVEYDTTNLETPADDDKRIFDVVGHKGQTYICIQQHTATAENEPQLPDFVGPTTWQDYWDLVAAKGSGGGELPEEEKSFLDKLSDFTDWIANASIGDLIEAALPWIGLAVAGAVVVDMMKPDAATGDGKADARFTGSPGFVTTGFTAPDVKDVIEALCDVADDVEYDTSALESEECQFVIGQTTAIRTVLNQLSLAYQFGMVSSSGVLKFRPRSASAIKTLTAADMGFATGEDSVPPSAYVSKRYQATTLPRNVTINYYAKDIDYNQFTQTSELVTFEEGQNVVLDVPVTLEHAKAKQIVEVALVNAHLGRMNYAWNGTYAQLELECDDVVNTPFGAVRITSVNENADNGIIEFEGEDAGVPEALIASNLEVIVPPPSTNIPVVIGYSAGMFIDPPALNSEDRNLRLMVAVHGYDVPGWPGAEVFMSKNNGESYEVVGSTSSEATVGIVETPIANHDWRVWDNDTEIIVKLRTNTLSSVTDLEVQNGANWALIGQELVGFANAVLIGDKTYRLSRLLRGRQGTEQFISLHVANELFTLMDSSIVVINGYDIADRGGVRKYKVVTRGSSIEKVDAQNVQMMSVNTIPWTVFGAKALKVGQDIQFSWNERVRFDNALKDLATTNHDSDWAGYGVVIYAADGTTIKRRATMTSENFTYTAAMQIADFGAVQTSVKADIAQISSIYGTGYPVTVNS